MVLWGCHNSEQFHTESSYPVQHGVRVAILLKRVIGWGEGEAVMWAVAVLLFFYWRSWDSKGIFARGNNSLASNCVEALGHHCVLASVHFYGMIKVLICMSSGVYLSDTAFTIKDTMGRTLSP